jgi:hypothetical protein
VAALRVTLVRLGLNIDDTISSGAAIDTLCACG